jgi:transcriptional regulator with XRE-family HTH domain
MEQQGLTQAQLADRLGVDRTYVSKVLSGSRQIRNVGRLRQVAGTIGVPPEWFGLLPDPGEPRSRQDKATSWHMMFGKTLMRGARYVWL